MQHITAATLLAWITAGISVRVVHTYPDGSAIVRVGGPLICGGA